MFKKSLIFFIHSIFSGVLIPQLLHGNQRCFSGSCFKKYNKNCMCLFPFWKKCIWKNPVHSYTDFFNIYINVFLSIKYAPPPPLPLHVDKTYKSRRFKKNLNQHYLPHFNVSSQIGFENKIFCLYILFNKLHNKRGNISAETIRYIFVT